MLLAALGLGVLCWVISRSGVLVPLGMIAGAVPFEVLLTRELFTGMNHWGGSINPTRLGLQTEVVTKLLISWTPS